MLLHNNSARIGVLVVLVVSTMCDGMQGGSARKPNIPENFVSNMFVNLTIPNLTKIYNATLWRLYTQGKQLSSELDKATRSNYYVSLVREDLKTEYDWINKTDKILSCKETPLEGNELYAMWEWLKQAVFVKQINTVYGIVDIWGLMETQNGGTHLLIELAVKESAVNVPLYMKMYPGPGYYYEFLYSEFNSQVDESVFTIPPACQKQHTISET